MDLRKISAKDLQAKLNNKENIFILDVRPKDQRKEWHIAESTHIDAYKRLNEGDYSVLDEVNIPENIPVVTVCAAGRTSLIASEALRQKGIKAYSLEGGMKAWNYAWNQAESEFPNGLKVVQVRRPAKGCLSYIAGSQKEAVVCDASLDPEIYLQLAKDHGWKIKYVTDTHIHADYISRTKELAAASGAAHLLIDKAQVEYSFTPVKDNSIITFGKSSLQIMHTPGHTWESTSFKIDDEVIFTGDTLFTDGVGRPDLKADQEEAIKKSRQLHQSLKRLLALPPASLVLPAHASGAVHFDGKLIGETIGNLKEKLELLNLNETDFVQYTLARIPPLPPNYLTIASINTKGTYEGFEPAELEAGGNHCAIG